MLIRRVGRETATLAEGCAHDAVERLSWDRERVVSLGLLRRVLRKRPGSGLENEQWRLAVRLRLKSRN